MKGINNKGFTLIELIGIIVVLVAIFLVAFPSLLGTTKQDEEKLYTSMVDDLCLAGETYIYSNIDDFPELSTPDSTIYLNISNLIKAGSVSKNKENPKTNKKINTDILIFTVLSDNSLKCEYSDEVTLVQYITSLYMSKDTVENNGITYNIDTTNQLIDDGLGGTISSGGNLRYYGANPNNYIDIGDRDSDGNIILWRIIGVFETKYATDSLPCDTDSDSDGHFDNCASEKLVKIIKADSIGNYSWDTPSDGIFDNNWRDATLNTILNKAYYFSELIDYYRYTCSNNCDIATSSFEVNEENLDFTSDGLTSNVYNKIEKALWNLGGLEHPTPEKYLFSNSLYEFERGTEVYSGNPTEWLGNIGLIYASDYAYATNFGQCSANLWGVDENPVCYQNNWIYDSSNHQWTITPNSNSKLIVFNYVNWGDYNASYPAGNEYAVYPSLYLKSTVEVTGTDTTEDGINYYIVE